MVDVSYEEPKLQRLIRARNNARKQFQEAGTERKLGYWEGVVDTLTMEIEELDYVMRESRRRAHHPGHMG